MMPLHFELVTPEKLVRSEDVHMVVVPGTEGDFGVLEGHAPLMSVIRTGEITVYSDANTVAARIHVEGGFAEVNDKGLTVLAEAAQDAA
jgi:F-type H+-transporting ATPase subunit epsilon